MASKGLRFQAAGAPGGPPVVGTRLTAAQQVPKIITYNVNNTFFDHPGTEADTYITDAFLEQGNISPRKREQYTTTGAATSVYSGTQGSVTSGAVAAALNTAAGAAASAAYGVVPPVPPPGSAAAVHAKQSVINAGLPPALGDMLMKAALAAGEPMVPVPAAYGGGIASQRRSSGSVMDYLHPPTMVSRATPITADAHAAAIAAASAAHAARK